MFTSTNSGSSMKISEKLVEKLIDLALEEDLGDGDHTSLATIPYDATGTAELLVKQEGILAGTEIAGFIFTRLDASSSFEMLIEDGSRIVPGQVAFRIRGRVQTLLQAERLVLNILQRMSGIATQTRIYVDAITGLPTRILDTRKTTPGMRVLEKLAVKIGGGENHRMGLYDMMLIKDNHIDFAGGIEAAVKRAVDYNNKNARSLKIEVEARSLDDVNRILAIGGVDRILLDNFTPEDTREAVQLIGDLCETESSGGITLENLRAYASCGVNYISVGALTHQIKSLDLSLKAIDY